MEVAIRPLIVLCIYKIIYLRGYIYIYTYSIGLCFLKVNIFRLFKGKPNGHHGVPYFDTYHTTSQEKPRSAAILRRKMHLGVINEGNRGNITAGLLL